MGDSTSINRFFESLVLPAPRPYAQRALSAQKRVADLLSCVGDPHLSLRCLHIAGSKGKGSTALYAEAIAEGAGLKTGTFTSPHLETWTERFRIDGSPVSEARLSTAIAQIRPYVEALKGKFPQDPPTFFDTLTCIALMMFAEANVDLAIIEAGIGARLDATRIVPADVACITTIEMEHTDKLGNTLAAIATQKAGVVRAGKPLVLGALASEAENVVRKNANIEGARVYQLGRDFSASAYRVDATHTQLEVTSHQHTLTVCLPQPATHIAMNASLALECLLHSRLVSVNEVFASAEKYLNQTLLPARVEVIKSKPPIIIDAAHTTISMSYLAELLTTFDAAFVGVISLSESKQIASVLEPLRPAVKRFITTRAEPIRSQSAGKLANFLSRRWPGIAITSIEDPEQALDVAYNEHIELGMGLCVTGSVYLAGRARRVLRARINAP